MRQSITIITVFILGYLLAIIFRSINGILAPNLIADVNLTASSLGLLTSTLLIAHAVAQIPLGVYLDSHGPKKVQKRPKWMLKLNFVCFLTFRKC